MPAQEYMERAKDIWEKELGLPPLRPQRPWYGYSLGQWDTESQEEAELALKGGYYNTGDKLAQRRISMIPKRSEK